MNEIRLAVYWDEIPVGKQNAITYAELIDAWKMNERRVRKILHELSLYDNGDNYILVRSASNKGFYRTDDAETIAAYKNECLNKGRSVFAPVKKINRVLRESETQYNLVNNMRAVREEKGMKQIEVCRQMKKYDNAIDNALLSKFENSVCIPTPFQLNKFAVIYGCEPSDLIDTNLYL